jgi:hypothetical protein
LITVRFVFGFESRWGRNDFGQLLRASWARGHYGPFFLSSERFADRLGPGVGPERPALTSPRAGA